MTTDTQYLEVAAQDARDLYDARFRKSQKDSLRAILTVSTVVVVLLVGGWVWTTFGWGWVVAGAFAIFLSWCAYAVWTAINYMLAELE